MSLRSNRSNVARALRPLLGGGEAPHRLTAAFTYIHSPSAVALGLVNVVNPAPRYTTYPAKGLNSITPHLILNKGFVQN